MVLQVWSKKLGGEIQFPTIWPSKVDPVSHRPPKKRIKTATEILGNLPTHVDAARRARSTSALNKKETALIPCQLSVVLTAHAIECRDSGEASSQTPRSNTAAHFAASLDFVKRPNKHSLLAPLTHFEFLHQARGFSPRMSCSNRVNVLLIRARTFFSPSLASFQQRGRFTIQIDHGLRMLLQN
jgi:hypothetical protein